MCLADSSWITHSKLKKAKVFHEQHEWVQDSDCSNFHLPTSFIASGGVAPKWRAVSELCAVPSDWLHVPWSLRWVSAPDRWFGWTFKQNGGYMEEGKWKYPNFVFFGLKKKAISKGKCNFKRKTPYVGVFWCCLLVWEKVGRPAWTKDMRKTNIYFWRPSPIASIVMVYLSTFTVKNIKCRYTYTSPMDGMGVDVPLKSQKLNFSPKFWKNPPFNISGPSQVGMLDWWLVDLPPNVTPQKQRLRMMPFYGKAMVNP